MSPAATEADLSLPRILCLHGGGVTGEIFRMQSRSLIRALPSFRLVFADGPFYCGPGPDITPVYGEFGPFRRWLRWIADDHAPLDDDAAVEEVEYALQTAMEGDAGTGPWVGLMGFSQGAKLAASLLYEQQIRLEATGSAPTDYKFAVLMAGRMPLVSLSELSRSEALVRPGDVSEGFVFEGKSDHVLTIPTIHVHGLKDPGLHLHRQLRDQYCDPDSVTLIEWDGAHRVPIASATVNRVCKEIYRLAREQGVRC